MAARPRVFSIPPATPFLPTLIAALREGRLIEGFPAADDPLALSRATIYLPTRRACRLAHALFLDLVDGPAALLPRLVPLGDVDEDELIFAEAPGAEALELSEALAPLERKLLLARLILQWTQSRDLRGEGRAPLVANTAPTALALADALGRLIDDMMTRQVPWSKLDTLVPDHLDRYWQFTLEFLRVAREYWPAILNERGAMEPAERRDRLIAAEGARLAAGVGGPVIAAGSTASMPATATLLMTIARLPQGAVVLPGLDTQLDDAAWELIDAPAEPDRLNVAIAHPQYAMRRFLAALEMHREEVVLLGESAQPARERLISDALRPAATTERWRELRASAPIEEALEGIHVVEAANPEEEALAVAVALREALETPGKTAALVTPDRGLARRVVVALARWNVAVDDSGGDALADTPAGVLARLAAEAALKGLEPVTLLALLKHPLTHLGSAGGAHRRAVSLLERAVLRGPRPRPASLGLTQALENLRAGLDALHAADPRAALAPADIDAAVALAVRLTDALRPLEELAFGRHSLADLALRHREVLAAIMRDGGSESLSSRDDGGSVAALLDELVESSTAKLLEVPAVDYADLLLTAMSGRVVRQVRETEPQVRILGPLEARLQHFDRIVLGGLVEGVWPPQTRSDPWLSRSMRQQLGLDLPERRIGLSAHDFAQALGCSEVFLTRPSKLAGAPTVASRFTQRLAAVIGPEAWKGLVERGAHYIHWAHALDDGPRAPALPAPEPSPPLDKRPTRLSVTEIEDWLRDPYTIYAKRILLLRPLDPVDTPPGARDRGSFIHAAIEDFSRAFAHALPADPLAELLRLGRARFAPLASYPEAQAYWWPRFERIAEWFVRWEARRRVDAAEVYVEAEGEVPIPGSQRGFLLRGRADRIERLAGGSYAIVDYKTGAPPTASQVQSGLAPQLTLEAAILRRGGFAGLPAAESVAELAYVRLRGGDPPGEPCEIGFKTTTPDDEAERAFVALTHLVIRFEDEAQPYRSLVTSMWRTRYGDYDHLARVKEWSATGGALDPDAMP